MKKLLLFFSIFLLFFSLSKPAFAQTSCYPRSSPGCFTDAINDAEINQSLHLTGTVNFSQDDWLNGITDKLIPLPDSSGNLQVNRFSNTVFGFLVNGIAVAYTSPPANLATWVQDTGQTLGFIPKSANAQSIGFNGLSPLLDLWKTFRNLAYILLSIAIVAIGFMIMFRKKIDPHTVVTVQNSIPRIIMVLVLITFSYAIAGLLIDLMYLVLIVSINVLAASFNLNGADLVRNFLESPFLSQEGLSGKVFAPLGMFRFETTAALSGGSAISLLLPPPFNIIIASILAILATFNSVTAAGGILSPLLWILFAIVLVFAFFRLFFMLLTAYIQILIGVIFAPIQILFDVFPGNNAFMSWIANIIANLLTFVLVAIFLTLAGFITERIGGTGFWTPPILGGVNEGLLRIVVGMGMIMIIPSMVNNVKEMLKAKPAVPIGLGSTLGSAGQAVGGIIGTIGAFSYLAPLAKGAAGLLNRSRLKADTGAGENHS